MTLIYHVCLYCFCSSSILVYGSVDTAAQCLLTLSNPEGCPVLCLKHSSRFLFAGLRNGTLMVYGRNNSGELLFLCFRNDGSRLRSARPGWGCSLSLLSAGSVRMCGNHCFIFFHLCYKVNEAKRSLSNNSKCKIHKEDKNLNWLHFLSTIFINLFAL